MPGSSTASQERMQQHQRVLLSLMTSDIYHHNHRLATMPKTSIGNDHGDKDDEDRIDMTSPDIFSEHLRTQNPKETLKFRKKNCPNSEETGIYTNASLPLPAQVLLFLIEVGEIIYKHKALLKKTPSLSHSIYIYIYIYLSVSFSLSSLSLSPLSRALSLSLSFSPSPSLSLSLSFFSLSLSLSLFLSPPSLSLSLSLSLLLSLFLEHGNLRRGRRCQCGLVGDVLTLGCAYCCNKVFFKLLMRLFLVGWPPWAKYGSQSVCINAQSLSLTMLACTGKFTQT